MGLHRREYGDPNLGTDVPGRSQFFIVAAVIVDGAALPGIRASLEAVRQEHFQAGPMKSQKLGKDRGRWQRVLTSLSTIPFGFYSLAVDKRWVDESSGLQWKHTSTYTVEQAQLSDLAVHPDFPKPSGFVASERLPMQLSSS